MVLVVDGRCLWQWLMFRGMGQWEGVGVWGPGKKREAAGPDPAGSFVTTAN